MKVCLWILVAICCLVTVSSKSQKADENIIDDEGVLEIDEENLIDDINIEDEKCGNQCENSMDQNDDNQVEEGVEDNVEIQTTDNQTKQQMKSNNEEAQTAEGYNVKDDKSCRVKKNSEKLSKVIRKTRSTNEKSQKVKENVQNKGEKLQKAEKKVQSITKQDKVKKESRTAVPESFKQISKKANGGKYRDQKQKTEKNLKVKQQGKGKESSKKNKKNEKTSQKKSQKNKMKSNKNEL